MALASSATSHILSSATIVSPIKTHPRPRPIISVTHMNSFVGLKSDNRVSSLASSPTSERLFAQLVARFAISSRSPSARGGAAASTCDTASIIFKVVPIMSALTLVGVALGFVLLRVEAALEESED